MNLKAEVHKFTSVSFAITSTPPRRNGKYRYVILGYQGGWRSSEWRDCGGLRNLLESIDKALLRRLPLVLHSLERRTSSLAAKPLLQQQSAAVTLPVTGVLSKVLPLLVSHGWVDYQSLRTADNYCSSLT